MSNPHVKKVVLNKPKANRLKPSKREKEHYVAYEIKSDNPLPFSADKELLRQIRFLLGVFLVPKANVACMKYNPELQSGVLRVNRKFVSHIKTCFVMIKNINGEVVLVRTLRVSGMISKLKKYVNKNN